MVTQVLQVHQWLGPWVNLYCCRQELNDHSVFGTSESIENKNKLRRLAIPFFIEGDYQQNKWSIITSKEGIREVQRGIRLP